MAYIPKKKHNTKQEIIKVGAQLFIENGYTATSAKMICSKLKISPGNLTFYFPSKEHLLAELARMLFDFQQILFDHVTNEGNSSLLAYCLELTSIAAVCEEDEVARDFFLSCYSSPLILDMIRVNDTQKTKRIFNKYRPNWTDEEWEATENVVSGIEYSTIITRKEKTPLPKLIERTLYCIMLIYGVDEETINDKINKLLNIDYRDVGRRILKEFKEYIMSTSEENLK